MNFYETLKTQLQKIPELINEEGNIKKWVVVHKAQNFDEKLISLLLDNQILKKEFFINIKEILVFNQYHFIQFLEYKNYFNDSYTQYKNKVGLTTAGRYLKQRNEVALVWPYKDCVLEGGQSREKDKREEIFFNETLAQDEITQLLAPKVLTNAKVFDKDGEHVFSSFHRDAEVNRQRGLSEYTITDNLIIKGNNLLALHSIKKEFVGKVKLIYIDPPYNTGGDANIFTYNNNFNHSTWLTFMKNRLEVAKKLLKEDGFIAIAIDHYELFYLGSLADEIFGRENRLGIITVVNNPMGRNQAKYFSTTNDFMLVYTKDGSNTNFNSVILDEEVNKSFNQQDEKGRYKLKDYIRIGGGDSNLRENKENFWYPLYLSPNLRQVSLEKTDGYHTVFPVTKSKQERTWKLSKTSTKEILNDLVGKYESQQYFIYEKFRVEKGQKVSTVWNQTKYNANHQGIRLLEKILGENKFSYPKSLYTVLDTLKIMTDENDIILDFFAGSGTTAHATLALNKEDGGNRQFILIEQLEQHIDVCKERNQKVIKQNHLDTSFTYFELKKYNQNFIEQIEVAKDTKTLLKMWEEMKNRSFLNYNVDIQKQENNMKGFKELSFKKQKQHLCELLDKNQMYVNLSSLKDEDLGCTNEEKQVTRDFYQ